MWSGLVVCLVMRMLLFPQVGLGKERTPHAEIFINEILITGHILSRKVFESCDFIILNPPRARHP